MHWQEAISKSKAGTATRVVKKDSRKETYIRYSDGSGYKLVSENGKVNFDESRIVEDYKLEGFTDWKPSKTK